MPPLVSEEASGSERPNGPATNLLQASCPRHGLSFLACALAARCFLALRRGGVGWPTLVLREGPKPIAVFVQVGNPDVWRHLQKCLSNVLMGASSASPSRKVDVHVGLLRSNLSARTEAKVVKRVVNDALELPWT